MAYRLNPVVAELRSSAIRDLLALTRSPDILSLAGGLPAADLFPTARLAELSRTLIDRMPAMALQYGPTEGDERLRAWIADYESARAAARVDPARVVVTAGSQQALDLLARVLAVPGDVVVVEEPAYLGALQVLRAAGALLEAVPGDADGLDVDVLAARLERGLRPAAVYVVTTFQNPTGAVLAPDRRRRLAELADRYGFAVIEDDPYAEIRFEGGPVPPVRRWSDDSVVTLGSFSKTVAPGLRVGWAVLPGRLVTPLTRLKQAADLHTGSLGQALIAELVADAVWWRDHLDQLRATYAARAQALAGSLAEAFGDRLRLGRPRGGMFLWGRFTDGTSSAALLPQALAHGVAFVPGAEFFVGEPDGAAVRLSFATNQPAALAEAVRRLAVAHAAASAPAITR
ncbi:MAG TPA: PLP-dependent aminotransferase family protein [Kineosporiaceae bacterium]